MNYQLTGRKDVVLHLNPSLIYSAASFCLDIKSMQGVLNV